MPLILDNPMAATADMQVDLGVDDLFGDAGMTLQTRPSKRLLQRVNELRSRGSCQYYSPARHTCLILTAIIGGWRGQRRAPLHL